MSGMQPGTQFLRNWHIDVFKTVAPTEGTVQTVSPTGEVGAPQPISPTAGRTLSQNTLWTSGLDLSALRTTFEIHAGDVLTPNIAIIKVYNPGPNTINNLVGGGFGGKSEFTRVILQAGYGDQKGVIFDGTIVQSFYNRENTTDTYIMLHCADGDDFFNRSFSSGTQSRDLTDASSVYDFIRRNATFSSGLTFGDLELQEELLQESQSGGGLPGTVGGTVPLPRGKVIWGMSRVFIQQLADRIGATVSIQQGKLTFTPRFKGAGGTVTEMHAQSGLIGLPTQTMDGIIARCLINPQIQVGSAVRINNSALVKSLVNVSRGNQSNPFIVPGNLLAHIATDGLYRVFAIDFKGDSRGNEWYQTLTMLSVDEPAGELAVAAAQGT